MKEFGVMMFVINLNVQGMTFPLSIEELTKSLKPLSDINSIRTDWESGRVQITREINKSADLIHLINHAGFRASIDLDEPENT